MFYFCDSDECGYVCTYIDGEIVVYVQIALCWADNPDTEIVEETEIPF